MADLSLAQGLIAAAKPRDVTAEIRERQRQAGQRAFQTGATIGGALGGAIARTSDEFAADPERFQLMQTLLRQDPLRYKKAQSRFEDFLKLREKGKPTPVVSPDYTRFRKETETAARNEARMIRASERLQKRRSEITGKYRYDLDTEIIRLEEEKAKAKKEVGLPGAAPGVATRVFRQIHREQNQLKKLKKKRDEELRRVDELISQQLKERQITPFIGPEKGITGTEFREASAAELRAARRALNRELPGKSALRQLIGFGAQEVQARARARGEGVTPLDIGKFLRDEAKFLIDTYVKPATTRVEAEVGPGPISQAFRTAALGIVNTITSPEIGIVAPGSEYQARRIASDAINNLTTYANNEIEAENVAIDAYREAGENIQKLNRDIKAQVLTGEISSITGILKMLTHLSMAKTIAIKKDSLNIIAEYSSPSILSSVTGGNKHLSLDPSHMRNISVITKENLKKADSKKLEQARRQFERILQGLFQELQVTAKDKETGEKYKVDFIGDVLKMDIDADTDKVIYETVTKGILNKVAPISRIDYNNAIQEKRETWQWLKGLAYLHGFVKDYQAFEDDILMENIIRSRLPWKVIQSGDYKKGFSGAFQRNLNKANKNSLKNNPLLFKAAKAGIDILSAFSETVKETVKGKIGLQ